jgi:acyl-CoA thioesterase-2
MTRIQDISFADLLRVEPHGPDTYVGPAVSYPWGGRLYGGQVIAQALRAAAETVSATRLVHSLHAYFIRPGTPEEPIRFEVERLRDGGSFSTRHVVARQSSGAILTMSSSFHSHEDAADLPGAVLDPELADPEDPVNERQGWGRLVDRRCPPGERRGLWLRLRTDIGDDPILQACALAFLSDAAPSRTARMSYPGMQGNDADHGRFSGASLDHALWFHRPGRVEDWHWYQMHPHGFSGARGLASGDVVSRSGVHVATVAQQVLFRVHGDDTSS